MPSSVLDLEVVWRHLEIGEIMLTSNPRLNAIPDASHGSPIKHWPEGAPDPEGGSRNDGEGDMVSCTNPTSQADEAGRDEIANPSYIVKDDIDLEEEWGMYQTQSHDCHQLKPPSIIDDDIIHVF